MQDPGRARPHDVYYIQRVDRSSGVFFGVAGVFFEGDQREGSEQIVLFVGIPKVTRLDSFSKRIEWVPPFLSLIGFCLVVELYGITPCFNR